MNALRAVYGLRRISLAVTNVLLSASTIHLLNLPSEAAAAHLSQALQDLEAMSVNHRFAARAIDIIRSLSSKWRIALPEGAASVAMYRIFGQTEMASSPSAFFAASIPQVPERARSGESSSSSSDSPFGPPGSQAIPQQTSVPTFYSDPMTPAHSSHSQTTFWTPFPVQGMPIPPAGHNTNTMYPLPSWPGILGDNIGPLMEPHARQQSAPGRLDERHIRFFQQGWSWQDP